MMVELHEVTPVVLSMWVTGKPRPKGSWDATPNGFKPNNVAVAAWQRHVAQVAREHYAGAAPQDWPMAVEVVFLFARPAEPMFDEPATTETGDIDKLLRAVLDALSAHNSRCARRCRKHAGVYVDDARVTRTVVEEQYAPPGGLAGAFIEVSRRPRRS